MPGAFIPINPNASPQALKLLQFVGAMQVVLQLGTTLNAQFNNLIFGNGGNFAAFETFMGCASGQGQNVFNAVNGAMQALNGTAQNSQCLNVANQIG